MKNRIKLIRIEKGLGTAYEVAGKIGVTAGTMCNWERNKNQPKPTMWTAISAVLQEPVDKVFIL
jgi:DNA-binding XRE family transcriptional regulator